MSSPETLDGLRLFMAALILLRVNSPHSLERTGSERRQPFKSFVRLWSGFSTFRKLTFRYSLTNAFAFCFGLTTFAIFGDGMGSVRNFVCGEINEDRPDLFSPLPFHHFSLPNFSLSFQNQTFQISISIFVLLGLDTGRCSCGVFLYFGLKNFCCSPTLYNHTYGFEIEMRFCGSKNGSEKLFICILVR